MAPTYSAENPAELQSLSDDHGGLTVIADLPQEEQKYSASKWSLRHLIAYRLLMQRETPVLTTFASDHAQACPVCLDEPFPGDSSPQVLDRDILHTLLQSFGPEDKLMPDKDLLRRPGGFFWVSLAQACQTVAGENRAYPDRDRRSTMRPGYVDSYAEISGSSSSSHSSASEFEDSGSQELDEDENEKRRGIPEDIAVRLMTDFIRYALQLCLVQQDDAIEIRPRIDRKRTKTEIAKYYITCEDDGGICRFARQRLGWQPTHPYLALLEGKRAFKQLHVNRDDKSHPVVTDETLAPYLGEAVITWHGNRSFLDRDVFVIAVSNTFVRFIHFHFGADYEEYLNANDKDQRILVKDTSKDTYVYGRFSKWFNLETKDGRKDALCHVLALLRWHDDHPSFR